MQAIRSVDPDPEHDAKYLEFAEASDYPSGMLDCYFVHPRTFWKGEMRHLADTSEKPRPGSLGQFFVISSCGEWSSLHRAMREDLGPVTCLSCLMMMVTAGV